MQKDRSTRIIAIIALCLAVAGVSVAFATMSTTLSIKGSAQMQTASWDIKFANLTTQTAGAAELLSEPKITDNIVIEDFNSKLTKPGDSVTLKFDIVNNGSLDADVASVLLGEADCTSALETPNTNDETIVCGNIKMSLVYDEATTAEQTQTAYEAGTAIEAGHKLLNGESVSAKLTLEYTGTTLPSANVNIEFSDTTILYEQA